MKEFDRWFNTDKLIDNLNTNYTDSVCSGLTWDTITEVSEYTWKAALEWAKNRSEVAKNLYMIDVNELDKELED